MLNQECSSTRRRVTSARRFPLAAKSFSLALTAGILLPSLAQAADWFRWRGPTLDGVSKETDWSTSWPKEGPRQLWKAAVGMGFSSVSVSKGRVFTMGNNGKEDTVSCFDAETGNPVWKYSYASPLDPKYYEGGPSATPTVDRDRVYTLSKRGVLNCLSATDGKPIWTKDLVAELGVKIPTWGFSSSALITGNLVIVNVGSAGTALDKTTGKVVWSSGKGESGYSTPVLFTEASLRYVALFLADSVAAFSVPDGKEIWRHKWQTEYDVNAADPIISGDKVFISSGYDRGAALLKIADNKPSVVWENKNMRNQFNSSVLIGRSLYGFDESELRCVDLNSGQVKWKQDGLGKGSLMAADGKLIVLSEKGELVVADASPEAFKPLARAQVLGGKCWSTPVLSNGRIYCRNAKGDLVCVDVAGK